MYTLFFDSVCVYLTFFTCEIVSRLYGGVINVSNILKELTEYFFSIITNEWICIHFFCTFALLLLNTNVKEIICTQQKDNYTSLTATADLFASMVRWQTGMD